MRSVLGLPSVPPTPRHVGLLLTEEVGGVEEAGRVRRPLLRVAGLFLHGGPCKRKRQLGAASPRRGRGGGGQVRRAIDCPGAGACPHTWTRAGQLIIGRHGDTPINTARLSARPRSATRSLCRSLTHSHWTLTVTEYSNSSWPPPWLVGPENNELKLVTRPT